MQNDEKTLTLEELYRAYIKSLTREEGDSEVRNEEKDHDLGIFLD